MNNSIRDIVNCIDAISNVNDYSISNHEVLINMLVSSTMRSGVDNKSLAKMRDAIGLWNQRLLEKYNEGCKLFDTADSLECFLPQYSICKVPQYLDYAEIYISILGMEYILVKNGTYDIKFCVRSIKRDFISLVGRFLFLYNGNIKRRLDDEEITCPNIFDNIFIHSIRIISTIKWKHDDYPQLRILILNLFDALGATEKSQVSDLIEFAVAESRTEYLENSLDIFQIVRESLDKYYNFTASDNNIAEIKTSWLYAYIYKKRFGFIFCKKISKSTSASSLPFKFMAFSNAFKNHTSLQVSNGPKVVLFEAGENKRSSEYIPTQSSAFYNLVSGMFE